MNVIRKAVKALSWCDARRLPGGWCLVAALIAGSLVAEDRPGVTELPAGRQTLADLLEAEEADPAKPKPPEARRAPIPPASLRSRAASSIKDVFGEDLRAAGTPAAKVELAGKMLQYVGESSDQATRFVLLESARQLAIDACDVALALDTARVLAESYEVDRTRIDIAALQAMAETGPSARLGPVVDALLDVARDLAPRDATLSEELAQAAALAARKLKDRDRGVAATQVLAEVRDAKKRSERIQPLVLRLQKSPDDAEAALELGSIRCFEEQDWEAGLPLLAKGSDQELAAVAKRDLLSGNDLRARGAVADQWWTYGKSKKGILAGGSLQRAQFHYAAVLEEAKGLDRAKVEKRLETLEQDLATTKGGPSNPMAPLVRQIGSNTLWLDAADLKTVLGEGSKPVKAGQGSNQVSAWMDRNGRNIGMAAGGPESRPTLVSARGMKAVIFDGKDDYLVGSKWPQSLKYPVTVSIVYALSAQALEDVRWRALFDNAHRANLGFVLQFRPDSGGYTMIAGTAEAKASASSDWQVVTAVFGQNDSAIYVGRRLAVSTAGGSEGKSIQPVCFLGCWGSPTGGPMENRFFAGAVGECLVFGKALSQKEVEALAGGLEAKWQK